MQNNRIDMLNTAKEICSNKYEYKENKALCVESKCENFMKKLVENNIVFDAIITDPPYNISQENNFDTLNRAGIDFGEWDKNFDTAFWIPYAAPLVKKGGSVIVFSAWREMGYIANELEKHGFIIKTMIRWEKKNPMPRNVDRLYLSDIEYAIWAVKKGDKWTFNRGNSKYRRPKYESGVVCGKERVGHPTQKSLKIMKEIIETHTNEGDLIFDPFSGSFTTMEACLHTNRLFIGTELDGKWLPIAKERFEKNK